MMRKPGSYVIGFLSLLCIMWLAACGTSGPILNGITVAPSSAPVNVGGTQQYTATGQYSDGTSKDLTSSTSITWASANTSIATVTSGGLATGKGAGTVNIIATYGTVVGQGQLMVTGATSLVVTPAYSIIAVAGTQQFTATATILNPDGTSAQNTDVTALASWTSSQAAVATIDSLQDATNGQATGVANGVTQVSASYFGANSNMVELTVGASTVLSLTITPATATVAAGQTQQFAATETESNGTTQPAAPGAVAWSMVCNPTGTASIGATSGLASTTASAGGASCTVTGKETLTGELPSSVSGTASLSVSAAVARFAYIANSAGGTISEYAANPAGGALEFLAKFPTAAPQQVIVHPSGLFLYSIDGNSYVHVYDVNPTTGALTPGVDGSKNALPPYLAGSGQANNKGVVDPTGSFLYVVDGFANTVTGFTITQSDGALTPLSPVSVGAGPTDILVDHTGAYLYTINDTDGDISGFTITAGTGVLVANPPTPAAAPYTAGSVGNPDFATIDPTNTYVYVPDGGSNVYGFTIGSTGILTAITGSPFANANALGLTNIIVTPNDKYIYELDFSNSAVYSFSVGTGGAIGTAIAAATTNTTGTSPLGIAVDPTSTLLAVDNNFSNTISLFQIGSTGALTTLTSASTDPTPLFVTFYNSGAAANVTPAEVLTADPTTGDVSAFTAAAGVLAADTNSPYAGVAGNSQIGTSVIDNLFFTGSASGKQLAGFSLIPATTPPIAALSGSPVTLAGAAGPVIADPSGLYVYAADTTNNVVYSYAYTNVSNSLALASTSSTTPAITGLQGLVSHPQGGLLYALSSAGTITPLVEAGGVFVAGAVPEALAGNWTVGAVDGSGQYLFAVDGTAKTLSYFVITPVNSGGTDGGLTAIGTGTAIPGAMQPAGIVVDPTDRFVLVTDATADTITPFTFNPGAGTLTAGTAVTTPSGAGQVTIDPTGTYVFVALAGAAGGTPPSGVAVYTVAVAKGVVTLTATTGSPFTTDGTAGKGGTTGVGIINSVK